MDCNKKRKWFVNEKYGFSSSSLFPFSHLYFFSWFFFSSLDLVLSEYFLLSKLLYFLVSFSFYKHFHEKTVIVVYSIMDLDLFNGFFFLPSLFSLYVVYATNDTWLLYTSIFLGEIIEKKIVFCLILTKNLIYRNIRENPKITFSITQDLWI